MAEVAAVGDPLAAAFLRISLVGELADPVLVEELLRPWLERRALPLTHDRTMAVLTAQQVVVDFGLATPSDFPSAWAMERWLEVRLAQTAALFTGSSAPVGPTAPSLRPRRAGLAGIGVVPLAWLARLHRSSWWLGATAATAVVAGVGAIALTAAVTSPELQPMVGQTAPPLVAGGTQALLPPPGQSASTPVSPHRAGTEPSRRSGSRARSAGNTATARPTPFQPVVIVMAPLGTTAVASSPPPRSGPGPVPPASPSPAACLPPIRSLHRMLHSRAFRNGLGPRAACPLPHPELPLPPAATRKPSGELPMVGARPAPSQPAQVLAASVHRGPSARHFPMPPPGRGSRAQPALRSMGRGARGRGRADRHWGLQ